MAKLKNYDGTITIDSGEAEYDRKQILSAQRKLKEALQKLKPDGVDSARFAGAARTVLDEHLYALTKNLNDAEFACGNLERYIGQVVAHYEAVDRAVAAQMKGGF